MMSGRFVEFNWDDIQELIYAKAGLEGDEIRTRGTRGEFCLTSDFDAPVNTKTTIVRVKIYDKPYDERIREHARDGNS